MQEKPQKKRGRPKKGEERPKELTEIEKQVDRSSEESLAALNKEAAWGGKKNSSGNTHYWKGGKLHLDVTDNGLPVTALYTGADVHDSQLAIPMEQITSSRIKYCYSVMDSAYNSCVIEEFIKRGHVPIIDPKKPKGGVKIPLAAKRYKIRSSVERAKLSSQAFTRGHAVNVWSSLSYRTEDTSILHFATLNRHRECQNSCFWGEPKHREMAFLCKKNWQKLHFREFD